MYNHSALPFTDFFFCRLRKIYRIPAAAASTPPKRRKKHSTHSACKASLFVNSFICSLRKSLYFLNYTTCKRTVSTKSVMIYCKKYPAPMSFSVTEIPTKFSEKRKNARCTCSVYLTFFQRRASPRSTATWQPTDSTRFMRDAMLWAASSPVQILLSYRL